MLSKYIIILNPHINQDLLIWTAIGLIATATYTVLTVTYFPDMSPITTEIIGTFLLITCVGLITKQNLWCWSFGIVGVTLLGHAFWTYGLVSTAILHFVFFLPMQFHGWKQWLKNENKERKITSLGLNKALILMLIVLAFPTNLWALNITDIAQLLGDVVPQMPVADAAIMWFSITAQILMNYKVLENWIFWITLDIIAIIVYFMAGMYMVSALHLFFLCIASMGFWAWWKELKGFRKLPADYF